jgi:hypothetical protein
MQTKAQQGIFIHIQVVQPGVFMIQRPTFGITLFATAASWVGAVVWKAPGVSG